MSVPPLPPNDPTVAPTSKAANPLHNGTVGRFSVYLTFGLLTLFALFLILDTVQFAITGHESPAFTSLTRGVGGLGVGSLLVTLGKSYFTKGQGG